MSVTSIRKYSLIHQHIPYIQVQLLADDGAMFIHHDISLPEFPLCLAWLDCPPFQADGGQLALGNYIAVGTFEVKSRTFVFFHLIPF